MAERARECFVVMPIRSEGTEDHAHYRALYDEILAPLLLANGYVATRADDIQRVGAITKAIIVALAHADLVLVDLTDLNPNVFYELGVRHALRRNGTVMIVDELRSQQIPFDVSAYRVVKFRGELTGFGALRKELSGFLERVEAQDADARDNPVHDWFPSLPEDLVASSERSKEGQLRTQLAAAQAKLRSYQERFDLPPADDQSTALDVISRALTDARAQNLPSELLRLAEAARQNRDSAAFLMVAERLLTRGSAIASRDFVRLVSIASDLGLGEVAGTMYAEAARTHPTDDELQRAQLAYYAHSEDRALRAKAREQILAELKLQVNLDAVVVPEDFDVGMLSLWTIMLDAYHEDGLHQDALRMADAMVKRFPSKTAAARNYARALDKVGQSEESLLWHRRSLWCDDANDLSAEWLGNELHNRDRHVDAIEAYLLGCMFDPDDALSFAHVSSEIGFARRSVLGPQQARRRLGLADPPAWRALPDNVDNESAQRFAYAALSCGSLDQRDLQRLSDGARLLGLDLDEIGVAAAAARMPIGERATLAGDVYAQLRSDLTAAPG